MEHHAKRYSRILVARLEAIREFDVWDKYGYTFNLHCNWNWFSVSQTSFVLSFQAIPLKFKRFNISHCCKTSHFTNSGKNQLIVSKDLIERIQGSCIYDITYLIWIASSNLCAFKLSLTSYTNKRSVFLKFDLTVLQNFTPTTSQKVFDNKCALQARGLFTWQRFLESMLWCMNCESTFK